MAGDDKKSVTLFSDPKARGRRLRQLRDLTGSTPGKSLTRAAIERKHGLSARTLKNWEYGNGAGISEKGGRRVINIYQKEGIQCSIDWLLEGTGTPPKRVLKVHAEKPIGEVTNPLAMVAQERQYFESLYPESITFEIKDDAMAPMYKPGDVVGGIRHYAYEISQLIDHDCIIELETGGIVLRRLQNSTVPGQYNLYALNASTKVERPTLYAVEILTAAPVTRHWRGKKWIYKTGRDE